MYEFKLSLTGPICLFIIAYGENEVNINQNNKFLSTEIQQLNMVLQLKSTWRERYHKSYSLVGCKTIPVTHA